MAQLLWDQVGDRRFETGLDRGVLYLPEGGTVPWSGLTSVTEDTGREVKSYYLDGVKYLDHHIPGAYSAKLSAFTYPDELDELLGTPEWAPGVRVHDQRARWFHLSYRTRVGNDIDGTDHGYRIHIVYNIVATVDGATMDTVGQSIAPKPFVWNLTGTPDNMFGLRPTNHISLDSRYMDPELLEDVEALLYGRDPNPAVEDDVGANPNLPSAIELLTMLEFNDPGPAT